MTALSYDAVVVGAGPNGLSAAVALALAGCRVLVREARPELGGGCRSEELTLPGFVHDVCSAVHPMAAYSPFFRALGLERHGLAWVQPEAPLAHAMDGAPVLLERSVEDTAAGLGRDAGAYVDLFGSLSGRLADLFDPPLGLARLLWRSSPLARHALALARSASGFARGLREPRARALLAGLAAHGMLDLALPPSNAVGVVLGALAHVVGWPVARGGSQRIADALAAKLRAAGGEIETDAPVTSLASLPRSRVVLLDLTPPQILRLEGVELPRWYARRLAAFRHGMAVFKVDWALSEPIPWRESALARAGTVHLGGPADEVAAAERRVWRGRVPREPFVLLSQPSAFDRTRAPRGAVVWAYAHVPLGSQIDLAGAIERRVEQQAPGFREVVLGRHVMSPRDLEAHDANLVAGDISGGAMTMTQLVRRPTLGWWATPVRGLYLCSSSTPPGPGVHGLCGFLAARRALRERFPARFLTRLQDELSARPSRAAVPPESSPWPSS